MLTGIMSLEVRVLGSWELGSWQVGKLVSWELGVGKSAVGKSEDWEVGNQGVEEWGSWRVWNLVMWWFGDWGSRACTELHHQSILHGHCHYLPLQLPLVQPDMYTASTQISKKSEKPSLSLIGHAWLEGMGSLHSKNMNILFINQNHQPVSNT